MLSAEPQDKVYLATTPSGRVYVGITSKELSTRVAQHYQAARASRSRGALCYFHHALTKYGQSVRWEVLEAAIEGRAAANLREKHFIHLFQANDPRRGYNGTEGGDAGAVPNKAVRVKLSQAAKARGVNPGQLENLVRGRQDSRAQSLRGLKASRFKGQQHTVESRDRMSRRQRQVVHTADWSAKIKQANRHPVVRSDGVIFDSAREAARQMGLSDDAVAKAIRQQRGCASFHFQSVGSPANSIDRRS